MAPRLQILYRAVHQALRLYWRIARPTTRGARALVINPENQVLLVHHSYTDGWYLPGGGLKKNESPEAGIRRELREETGIHTIDELSKHGEFLNTFEFKTDHITVFVARSFAQQSTHDIEITDQRFFAPTSLPEETSPGTRRRISEWLGERELTPTW